MADEVAGDPTALGTDPVADNAGPDATAPPGPNLDQIVGKRGAFVESTLGKCLIRSQDRAGFVVNALLIPYILSEIGMLESGLATADDIDQGMARGQHTPWVPGPD